MKSPTVQLSPSGQMPLLGFGTWQSQGDDVEKAVEAALEAGYRHIDTAAAYQNEKQIGTVLKRWLSSGKLARQDLFVVTKLPPVGVRASGPGQYLKQSLADLQLDYVDLYLVHTPFSFREGDELHPFDDQGQIMLDTSTDLVAVWKAMEEEVSAGRTKAIGVSNFNEAQIQRVLDHCTVPPANLQVELHLYLQQRPLVRYCRQNGITVTSYSSLGSRGTADLFKAFGYQKELPDLMSHPVVVGVAAEVGRTPAQVLLRHLLQQDIAVIPKSTNPARISQNYQVLDFELSEDMMKKLDDLDQGPAGRILDFLLFKGVDKHPEYPF